MTIEEKIMEMGQKIPEYERNAFKALSMSSWS